MIIIFILFCSVLFFFPFFLFCYIITYFKLYMFEYNSQIFSFALVCRIFIPFTVFDALTLVSAVLTRKYCIRVYELFHATTYTVQNLSDKFLKTASFLFFLYKNIKGQSILKTYLLVNPTYLYDSIPFAKMRVSYSLLFCKYVYAHFDSFQVIFAYFR